MKNSFFNFLIATNKLDEFLGYKDKETSNLKDDSDDEDDYYHEDDE